nr:MAG TPA: hypothetical protein [Caudoviricetes sp.]
MKGNFITRPPPPYPNCPKPYRQLRFLYFVSTAIYYLSNITLYSIFIPVPPPLSAYFY